MTVVDEVVDVDFGFHGSIQVLKVDQPNVYHVVVDGVVRHPDCSAEDAMRALGNYINSLSYKLQQLSAKETE